MPARNAIRENASGTMVFALRRGDADVLDRRTDAFGDDARAFGIGAWQQDAEFLAAKPGDGVGGAQHVWCPMDGG